jgi:hypothetical protein
MALHNTNLTYNNVTLLAVILAQLSIMIPTVGEHTVLHEGYRNTFFVVMVTSCTQHPNCVTFKGIFEHFMSLMTFLTEEFLTVNAICNSFNSLTAFGMAFVPTVRDLT